MSEQSSFCLAPFEERALSAPENGCLESFCLDLWVRIPEAETGPRRDTLSVLFRKQVPTTFPRLDNPEALGFQTNGDLRYQLTLFVDGRSTLERAFERRSVTFTAEDGRTVHTVKDFMLPLAEGFFPGGPQAEMAFRLTARRNTFSVEANGIEILRATDPHPLAGGYLSLAAGPAPVTSVKAWLTPIADDVAIMDVEPTPLLAHGTPLQHRVRIRWNNQLESSLEGAFLRVKHESGVAATVPLGTLPPDEKQREVFVPDVEAPGILHIELWSEGDAKPLSVFEKPWSPQRRWTLFVVVSAHEDLGYCDWITRLPGNLASYLDTSTTIADTVRDSEDAIVHRYMIEHVWWFRAYIANRSPEEVERLIETMIKPGHFEVMAVHSGTHTHWNDYEQLARSTYPARRELPDRWGIRPVTAFYADTPGIAWAAVAAFAQAGIRHILHCKGPWRTEGSSGNPCPDLFYWMAPNGRDRLLYHHRWSYTDALLDAFQGGYPRLLERIETYLEKRTDYPYDALCVTAYHDHELPNITAPDTLRRWRSAWAFPDLRLSTPTDYFSHMETTYSDRIPSLAGDINDAWGDYAAIDPQSMGHKNEAAATLSLIEPLASLARSMNPARTYPAADIAEICERMLEFDDHCWATMLPPTLMNILNNDVVKKANAALAHDTARRLLSNALDAVAGGSDAAPHAEVAIWNPRPRPAADIARVDLGPDLPEHPCLVDATTGTCTPLQLLDNGSGQCLAALPETPGVGFRMFSLASDTAAASSDWAKVDTTSLTTPHYRLCFDREKGTINGLYDRSLDVEWLDPSAPYPFNQFLFVTVPSMCSPEIAVHLPRPTGFDIQIGPVAAVVRMTFEEPVSGARGEHRLSFYRDDHRIDIENRFSNLDAFLYRGPIGKSYGDIGSRYLANVFYAFPFAVPDFRLRAEMAGGVLDLERDRLLGVKDFVMVRGWIDASNNQRGIALFTPDAPTVHPGEILYNRFLSSHTPEKSHLYVYAASNRMAGLSTRSIDDCSAAVRFSLLPHAGDWTAGGVPEWAWRRRMPLLAYRLTNRIPGETHSRPPASRLLTVDAPNVEMTVLKHAERPGGGLIARFVETHGSGGPVRITWHSGQLEAIQRTSLVEDDLDPVAVEEGRVCRVAVEPFGWLTLRLTIEEAPPPPAWDLRAEVSPDGRVMLSWEGEGNAWEVFRLPSPDAPLLAIHRLGTCIEPRFQDEEPSAEADAFYRVASAGAWNRLGPPSDSVNVGPTLRDAPPPPVGFLRVISWDTGRIILWWPSVARAATYDIERIDDDEAAEPVVIRVEAKTSAICFIVDEGLSPDRCYRYRVYAVDNTGRRGSPSPDTAARTLPPEGADSP